MSVVVDVEQPRILRAANERKASSRSGYFAALTLEPRGGITAIAMDMSEP